jgi:Tfp pilus assembly protein PilO
VTAKKIMQVIESSERYRAMRERLAQEKARRAATLKEKFDSNAEVQRWRHQMTKDDRTMDAIERMVPTAKEVLKMRNGGRDVTYEQARAKAIEIATRAERDKK